MSLTHLYCVNGNGDARWQHHWLHVEGHGAVLLWCVSQVEEFIVQSLLQLQDLQSDDGRVVQVVLHFNTCVQVQHNKTVIVGSLMLGPHWVRCTTKSVHTASQTKATVIYALSELPFSCPHRKDLRSHREGTYTPSGVYQRKATTIV